jgi:hypothetical protein
MIINYICKYIKAFIYNKLNKSRVHFCQNLLYI